ncbi:MAG TPA: IS110 family transposase [Chloroflexota bacterium]|nr:IS110 family transposase [Chloroflexota bacterium]
MLINVPPHAPVLAMDVHATSISAGVLQVGWDAPVVDKISADEESVRRLLARFEGSGPVWACYEAGPTGYELARLLRSAGVHCEVIAPSLIPTAPGQRVKTDRRDARRLALLFRAGQLSGVRVPTPAEEAVRDLCRARADMVIDRTRARHRLGKFLLRHGRVWRGGANWTLRHQAWVRAQRFEERALNETLAHYLATLDAREAAVEAIEADLSPWCGRAPFAAGVRRLSAYRGITELGALTLCAEVGDWRRFPTAGMFMAFTGLVPCEHSSGERTSRGSITHTGNAHLRTQLVEAAWSYKCRPQVGTAIKRRQEGLDQAVVARAWAAQLRLCGKFRRLDARKTNRKLVVTAVARELAGFVWAEMTAA